MQHHKQEGKLKRWNGGKEEADREKEGGVKAGQANGAIIKQIHEEEGRQDNEGKEN